MKPFDFVIISTSFGVLSFVFAWVAYRNIMPKCKIELYVDSNCYSNKLEIYITNIGVRTAFIEESHCVLNVFYPGINKYKMFTINFKDTKSFLFTNMISANGGQAFSAFEFNEPVEIDYLYVKSRFISFIQFKWEVNRKAILAVNNILNPQ